MQVGVLLNFHKLQELILCPCVLMMVVDARIYCLHIASFIIEMLKQNYFLFISIQKIYFLFISIKFNEDQVHHYYEIHIYEIDYVPTRSFETSKI